MPLEYIYENGKYAYSTDISAEEKLRMETEDGTIFGVAPFWNSGIDGFSRRSGKLVDKEVRRAIKSVFHDPHIWGGGHDPLVDTIHGAPILEHKHKAVTPDAWVSDIDYAKSAIVTHEDAQWEAVDGHLAAKNTPPATDSAIWRKLFTFDALRNVFPLAVKGTNSAIYVDSDAMDGAKAGLLFTARLSKGVAGEVIIGFAIDEPDVNMGFEGITKGLSFGIDTSNEDYLRLTVMRGDGTDRSFSLGSTSVNWDRSNGAVGFGSNLDLDFDLLRSGDSHSFRIESNRGIVTLFVDSVKFGTFTYPDDTYPLRRHTTGDNQPMGLYLGWMVNHADFHYAIQVNVPDTSSGFFFDLHDLTFYQLHPESVSHPLSRPDAELVPKLKALLTGDNRLPASAISGLPDAFMPPDRSDDTDATYFYIGWRVSGDGWLIKRQSRDTGTALNATSGAADFDAAWEIRTTLTYT